MARGANQFIRPDGDKMQPLPYLGVPEYYWGTNCLHSVLNLVNDTGCVGRGKCPVSFPANTGFAATFDRSTITAMAGTIGRELRSLYNARLAYGLDCWGPVINLVRSCCTLLICAPLAFGGHPALFKSCRVCRIEIRGGDEMVRAMAVSMPSFS